MVELVLSLAGVASSVEQVEILSWFEGWDPVRTFWMLALLKQQPLLLLVIIVFRLRCQYRLLENGAEWLTYIRQRQERDDTIWISRSGCCAARQII